VCTSRTSPITDVAILPCESRKMKNVILLWDIIRLECGRTYVAPSVQRRKVWLTITTWLLYSNAAKTRNPMKLAGVSQTTGSISAASKPKFTILWKHLDEILLLNKFFPIVDTCLSCEDIARQSWTMVRKWRLFCDFFASCISSEPRAARFRPAS